MRRAVCVILALTVFLWVLPLGAFIKASQEKTACGGGRAMHMCTMGSSKTAKTPAPEKVSFANASGAEKTNKPAGSGGNDVLLGTPSVDALETIRRDLEYYYVLPKQVVLGAPAPIPKI